MFYHCQLEYAVHTFLALFENCQEIKKNKEKKKVYQKLTNVFYTEKVKSHILGSSRCTYTEVYYIILNHILILFSMLQLVSHVSSFYFKMLIPSSFKHFLTRCQT